MYYIKNTEGNVGIIGPNGDVLLPAKYKSIAQSEQYTGTFHVTTHCGAIGLYTLKTNTLYLPKNLIEN